MRKISPFVLACALLMALPAKADDNTVKDSVSLNEVVVTGSKVQRSARNIPSTISVINQQDIENSGYSNIMPSLSQYVPGLFVTERGIAGYGVANGSAGAITIRGVGSVTGKPGDPLVNTQVLFLIDGHPQIMGLMGHHLSDSYLSENVERVEVIRGPASVLYGSNAMGGVINIITRKQKQEGYFGGFEASYGSYNTQHYTAHTSVKSGKWNGFLSLNREQTDGARLNSQYHNNSGYAKVGYDFSDHFRLTGDVNLTKYKAYDPDTVGAPLTTEKWVDVLRGVTSLTFENRFKHSSGNVALFWNFGEHHIYDGFHSTDHSAGVNIFQSFDLFKGNIIAGIDYVNYGGFAENQRLSDVVKVKMNFPVDRTLHEAAGYTNLQQAFFNRRLSLNAGIRYSVNSLYGHAWIPQGGISVTPINGTTLKTSVSKGFRSPTIKELYMFPPRNENLLPEQMMNYELSWQQLWLGGNLSTELTSFIARGSNLIRQVGMLLVNTGTFRNKGIETVADYRINTQLNIMANYSYLHMDQPVLAAPKHQAFCAIGYKPIKSLSFNLSVQHINELNIQTTPVLMTEDYTLVNLRTAYRPVPFMEINLSANNLLDQKYQINKGYPMPPTNLIGGVKFFMGKKM